MREIEKAHKEKKQSVSDNQSSVDLNYWQDRLYDEIPGTAHPLRSSHPPYQQPPSSPNEPPAGASSLKSLAPTFASPDRSRRDLQRMKDHHSILDDRLLGPHGHGRASSGLLHHQHSMPDYHAALYQTVSHSFSIGSAVQLKSDPSRYGIIKWIGALPGTLEGCIAGVEMVSCCYIVIGSGLCYVRLLHP